MYSLAFPSTAGSSVKGGVEWWSGMEEGAGEPGGGHICGVDTRPCSATLSPSPRCPGANQPASVSQAVASQMGEALTAPGEEGLTQSCNGVEEPSRQVNLAPVWVLESPRPTGLGALRTVPHVSFSETRGFDTFSVKPLPSTSLSEILVVVARNMREQS